MQTRNIDYAADGVILRGYAQMAPAALHGFANPAADGSMIRTALHLQSDRRAGVAMQPFFNEVLA